MAVIPYSTVVDISVVFQDNFVSRRGFGTTCFIQSKAVAGEVDATNRTKLYASIDEVGADFLTADEAYLAAQTAFSQNPRPVTFKVAYYDDTVATDAAGVASELDAIRAYDAEWYFLTVEKDLRDTAIVTDAIFAWAEARTCIAMIDSNDALMKDPSDTTNIAARNKSTTLKRSKVFYHEEVDEYPAVALSAVIGAFNLDDADSHYTPAFKRLQGITRSNINSAELQAVTGFVPGLGQDITQGHLASVYVNIGGQNHVQFGSVLSPNKFIDEVHFGDWLKARGEEEMFNIQLNNNVTPNDDRGMAMLASGLEVVLNRAIISRSIATDIDTETGLVSPAYKMVVPRALSAPASQRNARIAQQIRAYMRHAGAIHYARAGLFVTP